MKWFLSQHKRMKYNSQWNKYEYDMLLVYFDVYVYTNHDVLFTYKCLHTLLYTA